MTTTNYSGVAIFGGGCFWCTEAIFERLKGVASVTSGYAGGRKANPTYEQVSAGNTGHAEVNMISFDPGQISYQTLLEVFFALHDPTTLNRQGNDIGSQYRSVIFYTTSEQKEIAAKFMNKLLTDKIYQMPIVTELKSLDNFYPAEDFHQNYYNQNTNQAYCRLVISSKLKKLEKRYSKLLH